MDLDSTRKFIYSLVRYRNVNILCIEAVSAVHGKIVSKLSGNVNKVYPNLRPLKNYIDRMKT